MFNYFKIYLLNTTNSIPVYSLFTFRNAFSTATSRGSGCGTIGWFLTTASTGAHSIGAWFYWFCFLSCENRFVIGRWWVSRHIDLIRSVLFVLFFFRRNPIEVFLFDFASQIGTSFFFWWVNWGVCANVIVVQIFLCEFLSWIFQDLVVFNVGTCLTSLFEELKIWVYFITLIYWSHLPFPHIIHSHYYLYLNNNYIYNNI